MNKSLTVTLATLGMLVATAASAGNWAARDPHFVTCKSAMKREAGDEQALRVDDTYWISRTSGPRRKVLLNAETRAGESMRGVCQLRGRRVASIEVTPGRFVEPGRGRVEIRVASAD